MPSKKDIPPVLALIGPPGSSKGTTASYLSQVFNIIHISAGDLLREEIKRGTEVGLNVIAPILDKGGIIPSEITVGLLNDRIFEELSKKKKESESIENSSSENNNKSYVQAIILDGFPRKMDQARMFENDTAKFHAVIYFECDKEVLMKRLLARGRFDDTPEIMEKRFYANTAQCEPVAQHYEKCSSSRMIRVNTNNTVQEVCGRVKELFIKEFGFKVVDEKVEIPNVPKIE